MNYRHAYHAGNFADVLKHIVLVQIIAHLKQKPAPFRVIDTHAGVGLYHLAGLEAAKTGEWQDGIGRLWARRSGSKPLSVGLQALLEPYFQAVDQANSMVPADMAGDASAPRSEFDDAETGSVLTHDTGGNLYPGSPLIAAAVMRPQDRLLVNELHPNDRGALVQTLKAVRGRDSNVGEAVSRTNVSYKVMGLDGYTGLKSWLPPPERRAVVLIDPPFEEPGEFDRLVSGVDAAMKRFAQGTYVVWYPIKAVEPVERFKAQLSKSVAADHFFSEIYLRAPVVPNLLNGCGLAIINPPYTLKTRLEAGLPELVEMLKSQKDGFWTVSDGG
ncbi:MAG: 23S rRNA (adenine(2030)-N(6))-methyltransferase RlmJ [Pseudomonadota bacterium]